MHKWTGYGMTVLFLASIAVLFMAGRHKAPISQSTGVSTVSTSASENVPPPSTADSSAMSTDWDGGSEVIAKSDAGLTLLNGELAPAVQPGAPKSVVFGVILIQYRGAQGAGANARSRDAALSFAKQLSEEAKKDFKTAVAKGDKGSIDNAGRIPRGVLEPAPEYTLFSLEKGQVSEPVDTPRGFWIVQRIE